MNFVDSVGPIEFVEFPGPNSIIVHLSAPLTTASGVMHFSGPQEVPKSPDGFLGWLNRRLHGPPHNLRPSASQELGWRKVVLLSNAIFGIEGVTNVAVGGTFIRIEMSRPVSGWREVKQAVEEVLAQDPAM